jgi:hypothetical protein
MHIYVAYLATLRFLAGKEQNPESKNLWREPPLGLSAKNSSPRVKKILGEDKLSVN